MESNFEKVRKILKKYNQTHILAYFKNASEEQKQKLIEQILRIDFEELEELYYLAKKEIEIDVSKLEPIDVVIPERLPKEVLDEYIEIGEEIVKSQKLAVVILAGRTTELGFGYDKPKGALKLDIGENGKYLFEVLKDILQRANEKYNITIPWYIMTSEENNEATIDFLQKHKYFGYPEDSVCIFKQEEIPLLDEKGKVLIGDDMLIREASNGNGGVFHSMLYRGVIKELEDKGIEWVFIGAVDNVLLKLVDLPLIGMCVKNKTDIATKTVLKNNPEEKVGIFCKKKGKVKVIEYTEVPEEAAIRVDEHGEFIFGESNILSNLFSIKAVKKASTKELKYHVAFKRASYLNEEGKIIKPTKPNCYKFEKFIFDAFQLFDNISIMRGKREKDFAPIKNSKGIDSPETAKILYNNYWGLH